MGDERRRAAAEGDLLWTPPAARVAGSRMRRYVDWLRETLGLHFDGYDALWRWSITDLEAFWTSVADYFGVAWRAPAGAALPSRRMPGARWFEGGRLNHAEHLLRRRDEHPALLARAEDGAERVVSYAALAELTSRVSGGLGALGVGRGDRVAAFLPNVPEAVAAFLGTASLGAIWSSCAPEFGADAVLDRLRQIEPTVLFAVEGYRFGGRWFDRRPTLAAIQEQLPSLRTTILLQSPRDGAQDDAPAATDPLRTISWEAFLGPAGEPEFAAVPFDHPLKLVWKQGKYPGDQIDLKKWFTEEQIASAQGRMCEYAKVIAKRGS